MSLMIPDIVKWPISELTRFTFAEVCILQPLSHWAARSYQHAPVAVAWACFEPVHLLVCCLYGKAAATEGRSHLHACVLAFTFSCVFFSLNDIQASQDGWNGVTARFSHIIFSFCPCLHSSNPTGVVYVWQEKNCFQEGRRGITCISLSLLPVMIIEHILNGFYMRTEDCEYSVSRGTWIQGLF